MGGGRAPCCDKNKVKRGPWSPAEDLRLTAFIHSNGHANWRSLPKQAGLLRCGKSCRLRWINYLSPNVKRGNFTPEEEAAIIKLHASYGNKWSKIAAQLPGRTDNEIKNVWNTYLKKRLTADDHKENNSNIKTKNSASSLSSQSSSTTTSSVEDKGIITSSDHREVFQDKMPENLTQEYCARNAENVTTSRSSSFASNVSNSSTSTHDDHVAKASEETESLLFEEASDNYLEDLSKFDINVDTEFDVWSVLEELEILEAEEKGTTLQSSNGFGDENYIMNHDIELAEKSEWYKYLENNELGLVGIIGELDDQKIPESKTGETHVFHQEIIGLEVDMNFGFECWPSSPHIY